jgi:hypothetical protein
MTNEMQSIARIGANVLNTCAGILTVMLIFLVLESRDITARREASPTVVVNRALKTDRPIPVKQWLRSNYPLAPAFGRRLDDGCESLVSTLSHSPLAQNAGRCLS